ncbi:hypothetical protein [Ruficoccus sp. ZRK36]|uniref:hypothetical protein n=1 Tax=Ruficoccus sp. ZRK36 TaxID=2866311 RepID=UPI001C732A69|nr:hypothetical protein [Ruficoccus sp. ZRK36]QYY35096.1 hypothetical protein K0V07_12395 [Ruficoccus sp. ZRK36]
MAKKKKYKRLGRGSTLIQAFYLYDAEDHLLMVNGSFTEEYRRFYYQDIQAALIKNQVGKMVFLILLLLALLGGTAISLSAGGDFVPFALVLGLPALIILAWGLPIMLTGGFCKFYLQSEVQNMEIPPVKSVKKARKIISLIRERTAEQERQMPPPSPAAGRVLPPVLPRG